MLYSKIKETSALTVLAHSHSLSEIAHLAVSATNAQSSNNGCRGLLLYFCLVCFILLQSFKHVWYKILFDIVPFITHLS